MHELKKLKQMSPMSAEATVVRNYLDWVIALPWDDKTEDRHDINEAERILEAEHYGLKKVKERILEYLAVQALVPRQRGPILCLVGPPGVGKTSLARSIAHATARRFVSLKTAGWPRLAATVAVADWDPRVTTTFLSAPSDVSHGAWKFTCSTPLTFATAKIGAAIGTGGLSVLGTSLIARATADENVCEVAAGRAAPAAGTNAAATKSSPATSVEQNIGKALGKLFGR